MVPEDADSNTFWEHVYRYRFACSYVRGKRVLDIACGEGYGAAALLKSGASNLTGVDISAEACEHAAQRYGITTKTGDAKKIPLGDKSVDIVVSFETIEHVDQPDRFLDECVRVLAPGGKLIISTPNVDSRDNHTEPNPFHLKELNLKEFKSLLEERFERVDLYTQCPKNAVWWSLRSFSANQPFWRKISGFGYFQKLLRRIFCPEIHSADKLRQSRQDPIHFIMSESHRINSFGNPFAIRPFRAAVKEIPIYYAAVATLNKSASSKPWAGKS